MGEADTDLKSPHEKQEWVEISEEEPVLCRTLEQPEEPVVEEAMAEDQTVDEEEKEKAQVSSAQGTFFLLKPRATSIIHSCQRCFLFYRDGPVGTQKPLNPYLYVEADLCQKPSRLVTVP